MQPWDQFAHSFTVLIAPAIDDAYIPSDAEMFHAHVDERFRQFERAASRIQFRL
jgi:hypothetical protein